MNHYSWSPATDTHEIPSLLRGVPLAEQPTTELLLPPRPPVRCEPFTTRYVGLGARLRRSPLAADLRRGWDRTRTVLGLLLAAYAFIVVMRGAAVAADWAGLR